MKVVNVTLKLLVHDDAEIAEVLESIDIDLYDKIEEVISTEGYEDEE